MLDCKLSPQQSDQDPEQTNEHVYDLVIIGGGPAGLTAAIYAGRAALNAALLTGALPGGQVANTDLVENYPGFPEGIAGAELAQRHILQGSIHAVEDDLLCEPGQATGVTVLENGPEPAAGCSSTLILCRQNPAARIAHLNDAEGGRRRKKLVDHALDGKDHRAIACRAIFAEAIQVQAA